MRTALVLCGLAIACAACSEIDTSQLPSTDGYQSWTMLEKSNPIPGHGDTVRLIYINPVARSYPHFGRYPEGSVIVKEIHAGGAVRIEYRMPYRF